MAAVTFTPLTVDNGVAYATGSDGRVYAWVADMTGAYSWQYFAG